MLEGGGRGVSGDGLGARPQRGGEQAVRGYAAVGQAGRPRQMRGQGPYDGDEPGEENGLSTASGHEGLRPLPGGGGDVPSEATGAQAAAEEVPGTVAERVTGHDRAGGSGDDQGEIQVAGAGQGPGSQQDGQGRDERPQQQNGLGQHRGGQDHVGGRSGDLADHSGQRVHRATPAVMSGAAGTDEERGRRSCQTVAGGTLPHTVHRPTAYLRW